MGEGGGRAEEEGDRGTSVARKVVGTISFFSPVYAINTNPPLSRLSHLLVLAPTHTHMHAVHVCVSTIGSTRSAVPRGAYKQAINELGLAAGDAESLLTEPLLELRDGESAQVTCRL